MWMVCIRLLPEMPTMSAIFQTLPLLANRSLFVPGARDWLHGHRESVAMAGLLAFAAPVTYFVGAISVMRDPTPEPLVRLMLWWLLYGLELWALLLIAGYGDQRLGSRCGRVTRAALWLLFACVTAVSVTVSTAGRADVLAEQGVVQSSLTMHLHAGVFSFTMALLFMAHLRRSRTRAAASARLASAQAAQRETRAGLARTRLAAVQARIDPQLLFGMLEAVRRAYQVDAARAECLLDELIAFLRAALPPLRTSWSSLSHEATLAQAFVRLHALAGACEVDLSLCVSAQAIHARFPPGVLLPLLDDVLRASPGSCRMDVTRQADVCCVQLALPYPPSEEAMGRVDALLADLYGKSAQLTLTITGEGMKLPTVVMQIPYELA